MNGAGLQKDHALQVPALPRQGSHDLTFLVDCPV
jgi:hypothetical protein